MFFASRNQIDRCGDSFCKTPKDLEAVYGVQEYRALRLNCLTTSLEILNRAELPRAVLVSARLKRLDSILRKLTRPGSRFKLGQLEDIIGLRVVCRSYQGANDLGIRIGELPETYRVLNYAEFGAEKSTGYRSIHGIMKFDQKFNEELILSVRFEIQVRSFYQHRWAVWSEAHGEDVKLGVGETGVAAQKQRCTLRELSQRIAEWEQQNPEKEQHPLAKHVGSNHLIVAWKPAKKSPLVFEEFGNNAEDAVNHLCYLETEFPSARNNALLLIGVASAGEARSVLKETHPMFIVGQSPVPEAWMPIE